MDIGVIGVNSNSADLNYREKLAQNLLKSQFEKLKHPFSKVILNTCNRFEVYFQSPILSKAYTHLLDDFTYEFNRASKTQLYFYTKENCFKHLAKVTSGFESVMIGESEIQGQVKKAYLNAIEKQNCSKELHFLFQKSLKIGKWARSHMKPQKKLDLIQTVNSLLQSLKAIKRKPQVLFVGASNINQKIIDNICKASFDIFLTNRTTLKMESAVKNQKVQKIHWDCLSKWELFDGIVLATKSPSKLIEPKNYKSLNSKLIIDLSVPRNACEKLSLQPEIKLFNMDHIQRMVFAKRQMIASDYYSLAQKVEQAACLQYKIFLSKDSFSKPNVFR